MPILHWYEPLDRSLPMAAARVVRRERFAWPGGYELALIMEDGALLCAPCVESNWHEIASANLSRRFHRAPVSGWEPIGLTSAAESEPDYCTHCNRTLFSVED